MNGEGSGGVPAVPSGGGPGARRGRLVEAVADLRLARGCLLGVSDPRSAGAYLEAMRSCVTDIAEITAGEAAVSPPCSDEAAAGGDLPGACGRALGAVDQLLIGIADARRHSVRLTGGGLEAFAAGRAMLRLLLADRAAVETASCELLRAAAGYLSCPPAPQAGPSEQGGAPRRHDGAGGAPEQEEPLE